MCKLAAQIPNPRSRSLNPDCRQTGFPVSVVLLEHVNGFVADGAAGAVAQSLTLVLLILMCESCSYCGAEGEAAEQTAAGWSLTSVKLRRLLHSDAFSHIEHLTERIN